MPKVKDHQFTADITRVEQCPDRPYLKRKQGALYHGDIIHFEPFFERPHPNGGRARFAPCFPNTFSFETDICPIDEGVAMLLKGLVMALRPKVIFETGTHKGRSTRALAEGLAYNESGHLWTVDIDDYGVMDKVLGDNADYVTQVVGRCPDALNEAPLCDLQGIDLAILDGDHTGAALAAEIEFVEKRKAPLCYVVVDNAIDPGFPDIRRVLNEYTKFPRISLLTMCGTEIIFMHNGYDEDKTKALASSTETAAGA